MRLSWNSSGTYDQKSNNGSSYGGTLIYSCEANNPVSTGLEARRDFLYEFDYEFPWVSRGDLWTLAGIVEIQEAGGPKIEWRAGRQNKIETNVLKMADCPVLLRKAHMLRIYFPEWVLMKERLLL